MKYFKKNVDQLFLILLKARKDGSAQRQLAFKKIVIYIFLIHKKCEYIIKQLDMLQKTLGTVQKIRSKYVVCTMNTKNT